LGGLKKARNRGGIGALGFLAGAIHVEKAESDSRENRISAQLFTGEFRFGIRAGRGGRERFGFRHYGVVSINGAGASEHETLRTCTSSSLKN
jgi:hypothetical protein